MTRTIFTPPILFLTGINVFALFVAATFALLIGGGYRQIQISCDEIIPRAELFLQTMPVGMLSDALGSGEEDMSSLLSGLELLENMDAESMELYQINERLQEELEQYRHLIVQDFV